MWAAGQVLKDSVAAELAARGGANFISFKNPYC